MKNIAFLIGALALAGCQNGGVGMAESPAWYATASQEQQIAYFSKRCSAYGFKPGTNEMAQCLMTESQTSRSGARLQAARASQAMAASRPRSVTTNCDKIGNSVTCNSY